MPHPPPPRRITSIGDHVPWCFGIASFTNHLCEAVARDEPYPDGIVTTVKFRSDLQQPEPTRRHGMNELARLSARQVVMADMGRQIPKSVCHVPDSMVDVIPNHISDSPPVDMEDNRRRFGVEGKSVLLTLCLPGSGKGDFTSPRASIFAVLGPYEFEQEHSDHSDIQPVLELLIDKLLACWHQRAEDQWPWFEYGVTYDNIYLSQALILSGHAIPNPRALQVGLESLLWLISHQKSPVGQSRPLAIDGFHENNGERAVFDQQPIEAKAMVSACPATFHSTDALFWWHEARRVFDWSLVRNDLSLPLFDPASDACRGGLHRNRASESHRAVSTLAFQLTLAEMAAA